MYIGLNIWNDLPALRIGLKSIEPFVDGAIALDGSYLGYPTPYDYCTDGSIEYIEGVFGPDRVHVILCERLSEVDKRTKYFEYMNRSLNFNDWILIWDADMQIVPEHGKSYEDMKLELEKLRFMDINMLYTPFEIGHQPQDTQRSVMAFGYRGIPGLHYKHNHYTILDKDGENVRDSDYRVGSLKDSLILHWHNEKTRERMDQRSYYASRIKPFVERTNT